MAAPSIRGSTAPATGLAVTSPAGTQVGDMVIVLTWERAGAGSPTHTLQSGFSQIRTHAHDDGSTDGRLSAAFAVATVSGAQSYQAYTTSGSGTVRTGCIVLQAGTYYAGGSPGTAIANNSDSGTTNAAPDPPSLTGLTGDFLVLAIGAWHLGSAATVAVTAPTNYTETWECAGSQDVEFSLATRALTGLSNSTENPGAFADDVAPNGTARMTIAVPGGPFVRSVTASINAVVQQSALSITVSVGAVVQQSARTVTAGIDARVDVGSTTEDISASVDAVVQATRTVTASINAAVQATRAVAASADAVVRDTRSITASVDAVVRATRTVTAGLDAHVAQLGRTAAASIDAVIQTARAVTTSINAVVQASRSASMSADAVVQTARTVTAGLNAHVADASVPTINAEIDAVVQTMRSATAGLDAIVRDTDSVTASIDAFVLARRTLTASINAVVKGSRAVTIGLDARIVTTLVPHYNEAHSAAAAVSTSSASSAISGGGASMTIDVEED